MLIWLIVAAAAAVGEVLTTGLFLATAAVAAVITAIVAPYLPDPFQVVLFAALTLAGIALVRPLVVHSLGLETRTAHSGRPDQSHIVGRYAIVTQQVDGGSGQVRIGQGEFWSARSYDTSQRIPVGARVEVLLVEGVTALVTPLNALPSQEPDPVASGEKGEM